MLALEFFFLSSPTTTQPVEAFSSYVSLNVTTTLIIKTRMGRFE